MYSLLKFPTWPAVAVVNVSLASPNVNRIEPSTFDPPSTKAAFVPILFECTVFFASHLMVITYLIRCKLYPGSSETSPDPRTTDDMFLMEVEAHKNEAEIISLMNQTGAVEVKEEKIA